jgi:hypothetical protein
MRTAAASRTKERTVRAAPNVASVRWQPGPTAATTRTSRQKHRNEPGEVLPPERVLARLREYTTQRGAVSSRWLDRNDPTLLRSIRVHFGGLPGARRAANVARPPSGIRRWSELAVINELRRIQRAGRVRITFYGLKAAGYEALAGAIRLHVGSIARARRLARIPDPGRLPTGALERWDEDRVIAEIRDRYRNGETLAASKVPIKLHIAARRYCGGWPTAIELAGFDYDQIRITRSPWTREDLIARIKRAAHELAHNRRAPPISALIARIQNPIMRLFGTVADALRAAGIDPTSVMRHVPRDKRSKSDLLAALRAALAKQPAKKSTEFFQTRLGREAIARFGSVTAAIEQIGEEHWTAPRKGPPLPTASEVVRGLRARYRQGAIMGYTATFREDQRLLLGAKKHFGTWRRAMEAAGFGHLVGLVRAVSRTEKPVRRRTSQSRPRAHRAAADDS